MMNALCHVGAALDMSRRLLDLLGAFLGLLSFPDTSEEVKCHSRLSAMFKCQIPGRRIMDECAVKLEKVHFSGGPRS